MSYLREHGTRAIPQSESLPGQVENSAGGHAWAIDAWTRLRRFLILGSEGGSYYATERKLTTENVDALRECVQADGPRLVREVVSISEGGLAPKNDQAIFALAYAIAEGDQATKRNALAALPRVCRIGTHLFMLADFLDGGFGKLTGRAKRRAFGRWYTDKTPEDLAYQLVKYRQRGGWSHRDVLRLMHPKPTTAEHAALFDFACGREVREGGDLVRAFIRAQEAKTPAETAELIVDYGLPREAVQPEHLNDPAVWAALLKDMPMTAMIRNLATMTRVGVVAPNSAGTQRVLAQLGDQERLRKSRVHPLSILTALAIYRSGEGLRGQHTWNPVVQVVDALDAAFYSAFGNVESTGKRWLLALDISGSMTWGNVAGSPLTPRDATAALALVTANVESAYETVGFSHGLIPLQISPRQRLDDAIQTISNLPFGGTDCALPMLYALQNKREVDVFVVYTDSETWAGSIHPAQALAEYRRQTGIAARLIVVGMVANDFSIADPNDAGMLDVVGFDTSVPQVMGEFAAGRV